MDKEPIKFIAEVYKVQTLVDGGIRLVLDLPEEGRKNLEALAECHQNGVALLVEAKRI